MSATLKTKQQFIELRADNESLAKIAKKLKVSKEEFLNTFKSAPHKIRAGSAIEKDRVCRILFLNLRVDNEKVTSYLWREPFRSLVTFIETLMVRMRGLEPPQDCSHYHLKVARLPIPPRPLAE